MYGLAAVADIVGHRFRESTNNKRRRTRTGTGGLSSRAVVSSIPSVPYAKRRVHAPNKGVTTVRFFFCTRCPIYTFRTYRAKTETNKIVGGR